MTLQKKKKKWDKYEMNGITSHVCRSKPERQHQQPPVQRQSPDSKLSKEIAAIKPQLLVLVSRLDRIEAGLHTYVS
jgi:hypothetical protein